MLRQARRLIAEVGWCQKSWAQFSTPPKVENLTAPEACAFCLSGALYRAEHDVASGIAKTDNVYRVGVGGHVAFNTVLEVLRDRPDGMTVIGWNDVRGRTREEVVSILDEAIGRLE